MDDLERLLAERACERLMLDYAWAVDLGNASAIADLFTEDGTWTSDDGLTMVGRDGIRRGFARREANTARLSRHGMLNTRIVVADDGGHATGRTLLVNFRHDRSDADPEPHGPGPARHPKFVGDYVLTFARTVEGWRIATLRFEVTFLRRGPETTAG